MREKKIEEKEKMMARCKIVEIRKAKEIYERLGFKKPFIKLNCIIMCQKKRKNKESERARERERMCVSVSVSECVCV